MRALLPGVHFRMWNDGGGEKKACMVLLLGENQKIVGNQRFRKSSSIEGNYLFSITTKNGNLPLSFLVVIIICFYWIIFINNCLCILTGSPGIFFDSCMWYCNKLGLMIIHQFYQHMGNYHYHSENRVITQFLPTITCSKAQSDMAMGRAPCIESQSHMWSAHIEPMRRDQIMVLWEGRWLYRRDGCGVWDRGKGWSETCNDNIYIITVTKITTDLYTLVMCLISHQWTPSIFTTMYQFLSVWRCIGMGDSQMQISGGTEGQHAEKW